MSSNRAIVLLSGGMDSLVTAAIAMKENDEVNFLHLNYGQLTEERELCSFRQMVEYFKPADSMIVDVSYLKKIGGSSLTDEKIPVKKHHESKGIPDSYVPFRNAHLIAIAVSWAEVIRANRIYIGAVEEDSSGYPDCRENFYKSFEETISLGTKNETPIKIITPIIHKSKADIVRLGQSLSVPFQFSWSCYQDNEIACGECASCYLRQRAFYQAGLTDPIAYRNITDPKKYKK